MKLVIAIAVMLAVCASARHHLRGGNDAQINHYVNSIGHILKERGQHLTALTKNIDDNSRIPDKKKRKVAQETIHNAIKAVKGIDSQ